MKASKLFLPSLCCLLLAQGATAGKEVDRLLAEYAKIKTVTCQVRRTKEGALGKMKFLSRVYYTNQNQIHAEGIAPMRRRTISDGQQLFQYVEGDPKGFSRPVDQLSEKMLISLKLVPGTAMEHLLRLKNSPETDLAPSPNASKSIGIQTDGNYVVLNFDSSNRLSGIDFFKSDKQLQKVASYSYSQFSQAAPDVWIPLTHQSEIKDENIEFKETVKFDRFIANAPIAESLFIPSSFFDKDIDFVDDFTKIYPK